MEMTGGITREQMRSGGGGSPIGLPIHARVHQGGGRRGGGVKGTYHCSMVDCWWNNVCPVY